MTTMRPNTSKFRLTQLALHAAVELERARAGETVRREPLEALSTALLRTSGINESSAPFRFVEPGFYQPLQRLYHDQEPVGVADVEHIQALIRRTSEALTAAATGSQADTEALVRFCVALHQELIEGLTVEDAFIGREGRTHGHGAAASISAA